MSTTAGLYDYTFILAGTGNLAWNWPSILSNAGLRFAYVYGRDQQKVEELAEWAGAFPVTDSTALPVSEKTIIILAVNDTAIEDLAQFLAADNRIMVHCSGSMPSSMCKNGGVLYPLQTFSKNRHVDVESIPFYVSAEKEEMKALFVQLAMMINGKVEVISDEQRLCLHLAAVATHNFSNHLMALADAFLAEKNLDYKALLPLMTEMTLKWKEAHPLSIQTGPAIRHDDLVIQKHLELLREYANFSDVYTVLTNSIRKNQSS